MFEANAMLFIYTETQLHAGAGRGLGAVDLPIQRERTTGYPKVQGGGVKGRLRAAAADKVDGASFTADDVEVLFGPETTNADAFAGALSVGEASLLLFPVASLAGVFAWVTSLDLLARFQRTIVSLGMGLKLNPAWTLPDTGPAKGQVWVTDQTCDLVIKGIGGNSNSQAVVFYEYSYTPVKHALVNTVAADLVKALPQGPEYDYWRKALPRKLCIVPNDVLRDFAATKTAIEYHTRLNDETKTVESGALWSVENLPVDTLLYCPLMATRARKPGVTLDGKAVLKKFTDLKLTRVNLGGDETTGQGMVALNILGG